MDFVEVNTQAQIDATAALAEIIWTDHYVQIVGKRQVEYMLDKFQSSQAISKQIANGWLYYLLTENGKEIGYIALIPNKTASEMKLSKYYILKSYRGKGRGRECINFIINLCFQLGLKTLWLTVNKDNQTVKIYEKLGFTNAGSIVADIGNGFVMDDYKMVMQILNKD